MRGPLGIWAIVQPELESQVNFGQDVKTVDSLVWQARQSQKMVALACQQSVVVAAQRYHQRVAEVWSFVAVQQYSDVSTFQLQCKSDVCSDLQLRCDYLTPKAYEVLWFSWTRMP